jgi:hypothetical protein
MFAVISARAEGRETSPKRSRVRAKPGEVRVSLAFKEFLRIEADCMEYRANGWRGGRPQPPIKREFELYLTREDVESILEQLFAQGIPKQIGVKLYRQIDLEQILVNLAAAKKAADKASTLIAMTLNAVERTEG